jgi:hypothetical protein
MMRTHKVPMYRGEIYFNYDPDFATDVEISRCDDDETTRHSTKVKIPMATLVEFIAHCYVQPKRLRKLRDATEKLRELEIAISHATIDEILGIRLDP